jgi:hypothetical protein
VVVVETFPIVDVEYTVDVVMAAVVDWGVVVVVETFPIVDVEYTVDVVKLYAYA